MVVTTARATTKVARAMVAGATRTTATTVTTAAAMAAMMMPKGDKHNMFWYLLTVLTYQSHVTSL